MLKFDEIGIWSEIKLDIVRAYAAEYSRILAKQARFHHVYIDGFAGAGLHLAKVSGELVQGSPLNALEIDPPFREYFFVDLNGDKVQNLRELVGDRADVHVLHGDCNRALLEEVLPQVRYEQFRRGLCLLDPYGLHLDWTVLAEAGRMGTIDLFLNFPTMDINRNALWLKPDRVAPEDQARMTAFWGDDSWRTELYRPAAQLGLFAGPDVEKADNLEVAEAFRERLEKVAGFRHVPAPLPMRNSRGAIVYYLFFASQKDVATFHVLPRERSDSSGSSRTLA